MVLVSPIPNMLNLLELNIMQTGKNAALSYQFIVFTIFRNSVLRHNDDSVGIPDCCKPMRNDKRRPVFRKLVQRLLDDALRFRIEG